MFQSKPMLSRISKGALFFSVCLFGAINQPKADSASVVPPVYSPVVNGEALRGLSTIGSAESMGEGRITFGFFAPWYHQQNTYLQTPNAGANIFVGTGAFSYGVNPFVDLFASVSGYGISNYDKDMQSSGVGSIRAGVQGSVPFPRYAPIRMGGQLAIIGGTSQNQINIYRADGYNYFETRNSFDFVGKLMQTLQAGNEDWGFKAHLNEAGVLSISKDNPSVLLLGTGLQANLGAIVLGTELNSRTQFKDMAFGTDPLWVTPTLRVRTPYEMNVTVGADVSLSADRSGISPRALEPYRVFVALAFSFDMLAGKRAEALAQKQKAAQEKANLEAKAAKSANEVRSLTKNSIEDSIELANQKQASREQMDSMQTQANNDALANQASANLMATKATADSLALIQSAKDLALEKEKRSEAEKKLLSTGELLLDAVYFESGKTIISINSKPYLNIIAAMLIKYPKLQIEIGGHTDNIGAAEYNLNLSQGRAESVRMYLIGVSPALNATLSSRGYGMSMPKAENTTADGRLSNRRVELRVTNKDALMMYTQK